MMKSIKTNKAPEAIGPYSQGVAFNDLIFTSGQIAINPKTNSLIEGGVKEQIIQIFENLKNILEADGSSLNNIIKTSVFLKHMSDFTVLNQIYSEQLKDPYPARSCFEVTNLPKDALVEIEVIAYKNS
ncbi:MAG: endoribonuclease [Clostridia bacterium]|nr:endoribonuclease [Clostridia bacterium]